MKVVGISGGKGFTIVELLIVIVVIGILAAITIVSYNGIQNRAKVQTVNTDLSQLAKAITVARINESKALKDITGSGCTNCGNQAVYEQTLDRIGAAAGMRLDGLKKGNPWGAKYVIDENELENMSYNSGCNRDGIGIGNNVPSDLVSSIVVPTIPTYTC